MDLVYLSAITLLFAVTVALVIACHKLDLGSGKPERQS